MAHPVIRKRFVPSKVLQNVGSVLRDPGLEQMQIMESQITEFASVYTPFTKGDTNVSFIYCSYLYI